MEQNTVLGKCFDNNYRLLKKVMYIRELNCLLTSTFYSLVLVRIIECLNKIQNYVGNKPGSLLDQHKQMAQILSYISYIVHDVKEGNFICPSFFLSLIWWFLEKFLREWWR